jgi:hypothetical protein
MSGGQSGQGRAKQQAKEREIQTCVYRLDMPHGIILCQHCIMERTEEKTKKQNRKGWICLM